MQIEYGARPTSCAVDVGGLYPKGKMVGGRVSVVIRHPLNLALISAGTTSPSAEHKPVVSEQSLGGRISVELH